MAPDNSLLTRKDFSRKLEAGRAGQSFLKRGSSGDVRLEVWPTKLRLAKLEDEVRVEASKTRVG
jgi:hypothetical protein